MKQILQSLSSGDTKVVDVPSPQINNNSVLISTNCSLISAGTERMLMRFGKASLFGKAKRQPEKVKQVWEKIKTDGLLATLDAVKSKLDQPITLGYSNVGVIAAVGNGVQTFSVGDRVLSNGAHAESVSVSKNLCVKIPNEVSDESAAFAVLGAIGLQGIRLAQPTLGENFVVLGLGLIGLLTVQLLRAQGCRVLGIDFDPVKLLLAKQFGANVVDLSQDEDILAQAINFSRGRGVDGVLITASTKSSDPIHQACLMSRKRSRIVLVGVTGLQLSREDFYRKELSFQVSCSYGPGRYDPDYEEKGHDYPIGFVRWTEQRNMEAVLDMMAEGKLNIEPLISHRFEIEQAELAYQKLDSDPGSLGIILHYPRCGDMDRKVLLSKHKPKVENGLKERPVVAFVGAGNYASRVLIPAFRRRKNVHLHTIISEQGASAVIHGRKNGFDYASTDYDEVLNNTDINTVIIATRHNQHAEQVIKALRAGKHVFVEKPLVIAEDDLEKVSIVYQETSQKFPDQKLMVGFNRRFSPYIKKMKELLGTVSSPKYLSMVVNAGFIPSDHWTQDWQVGGGRFVGEGCHFVDLLRFLVGREIIESHILGMLPENDTSPKTENVMVMLKFADGSLGHINYFANGHKNLPKERLEVSVAGKVLQLDNFIKLVGYGWTKFKKMSTWKQDKGQFLAVESFVSAIENGNNSPIDFEEIIEVMRICLILSKRLF